MDAKVAQCCEETSKRSKPRTPMIAEISLLMLPAIEIDVAEVILYKVM